MISDRFNSAALPNRSSIIVEPVENDVDSLAEGAELASKISQKTTFYRSASDKRSSLVRLIHHLARIAAAKDFEQETTKGAHARSWEIAQ